MTTEETSILPHEIAFDIDGVCLDTFRVFVSTARQDYGVNLHYEDITEYEFWKFMDLDETMCQEIIQRMIAYPVEMEIKPMAGAIEVLNRMLDMGSLLLVTARPLRQQILSWFDLHLKREKMEILKIEATGDYKEKPDILKKHGIKYFVEDRLDTCYLLQKNLITPIVFDQPWNRQPHPFMRTANWGELSEMITWQPTEGGQSA